MFVIIEFFVSLQPQNRKEQLIGLWCNGNTTDSGPVIPGSNPGSPTIKKTALENAVFFIVGKWLISR